MWGKFMRDRTMGAGGRCCEGKRLAAVCLLLLIIVASPLLSFAEEKTGQGSFLIITDLHFDPFADPSLVNRLASADYLEWENILETSELHSIGSYGKDASYPLVKSALDALRRVTPPPDFILFSGDFLAHDFRDGFNKYALDKSDPAYKRFIEKTIRFLARMFDSRFPSVPVLPTLGNNDSDCGDYGVEPGGGFLKMFAVVWAPLIARGGTPASFLETFPVGGYYNMLIPALKGHRIIVLNANFFSAKARNCGSDTEDAGAKELQWLDWTLYQSHLGGKKAWILYHEPVGVDVYSSLRNSGDCRTSITMMLKESYNTGLLNIIGKYAPLVEASFSGHTHMDDLRVVASNGAPTFFTHITPSVSPVFGNNPAFQRFEYDQGSGAITDYATYILKNFPTLRNGEDAHWAMEYDYGKAYGQKGYTPAALASLYRSLENSATVRADYMRFYSSETRSGVTEKNWKAYWCAIGNADAKSFGDCFCGEK
jgi:hypothetical protein